MPESPTSATNAPSEPSENIEDSEIVFAMVAAVGVNLEIAENALSARLKEYQYQVERIKITQDVIPHIFKGTKTKATGSDFQRINKMMDLGDAARNLLKNPILAKGAAAEIKSRREKSKAKNPRTAYIIHSLKHPEEARMLREIYPRGFHLIGVHAHPDFRRKHLMQRRKTTEDEAEKLMQRDRKAEEKHGQQLVDTFHLADFFVGWSGDDSTETTQASLGLETSMGQPLETFYEENSKRVAAAIHRYVDLVFGHTYKTPTFGEHAMFMAFTASLRSADLSRQVGAVVARDGELLSNGSNDCPSAQGGLYWPYVDPLTHKVEDIEKGRDFKRGVDSNRKEQDSLMEHIRDEFSAELDTLEEAKDSDLQKLKLSNPEYAKIRSAFQKSLNTALETGGIRNLTEYGRVVHAEMEAILSCTRQGISTKGAAIYCTTFPCHNCAKHIIASGISRVIFVEPYLKSKALDFHNEAIVIHYPQDGRSADSDVEFPNKPRVRFEPFFGVGPRRYLDLFSVSLGAGRPLQRKDSSGRTIDWSEDEALPRLRMHRESYLKLEASAANEFKNAIVKDEEALAKVM